MLVFFQTWLGKNLAMIFWKVFISTSCVMINDRVANGLDYYEKSVDWKDTITISEESIQS